MAGLEEFEILDRVVCELDVTGALPFQGIRVLAVQHVHSSMLPLVVALCGGGVKPEDVTVVGKSYSTKASAVAMLRAYGVNVVDSGRMSDALRSYEDELDASVEGVLGRIRAESGADAPLLVLDEGAVASKILTRRADLAANVRVVEQTTRGARWIDTASVAFPVVDVARSAAKAQLEAPLVARSMVDGLLSVLSLISASPRRAGVIGYGRMGARLAELLSQHFEVVVHDLDETNAAEARTAGLPVLGFTALLDDVDLIVGCTGNGVLDAAKLATVRRPLILVNGASSDIEFILWGYRRASAILPGSDGDPSRPWANHYRIDLGASHVLLAGGFPINFHGAAEPISAKDFQLTRALMLGGAVQVCAQRAGGVTALGGEIQEIVGSAYAAMKGRAGTATA